MRLVIDVNVAFSLFLKPDSEELNIVASANHEVYLCRFVL